jgi:tRNA threonylcarbamoyl adenosine modification protein YeaZ
MLTLLIEACTERGVVAIFRDKESLYQEILPFGYSNSKYLIPSLQKGLGDLKISLSDFAFITVGVGPGSYTGMRVAAITAKTWAYTHHLPLVCLSTLQGFLPSCEGAFTVLIDAKTGGAYALSGRFIEGKVHYVGEPQVYSLENLGMLLEKAPLIVTPNGNRLRNSLGERYPHLPLQWQEHAPCPAHMTSLAQEMFLSGNSIDCHALELLYLR